MAFISYTRVCLSSNWEKDWPPSPVRPLPVAFFHQGEGDVALQLAPPFLSSVALLGRPGDIEEGVSLLLPSYLAHVSSKDIYVFDVSW